MTRFSTGLLFSLALAGLFAAPASADLLCASPKGVPAAYQSAYERTPVSVRRVNVTFAAYRSVNCGELPGGYWVAHPDYGPTLAARNLNVFLHELGHHAWVYAGVDQAGWQLLWRRYGGRGAYYEGFARSFQRWQQGKRVRPELRAFLER